MKKPEFKLPKLSLEIPEAGKGRTIAVIVISVLLVLMLVFTIIFRVMSARQAAGVQAIRKAGVLRAAVPVESRLEEHPEDNLTAAEKDLLQTIADQLGVEVEYAGAYEPQGTLAMVVNREANLAVGSLTAGSVPKNYAGKVSGSQPYDTESLYVVTRKGDYSDSRAAFAGRVVRQSPSLSKAGFEVFSGEEQTVDSCSAENAYGMLKDHYLEGWFCTKKEAAEILAMGKDVQGQLLSGEEGLAFVIITAPQSRDLLSGINQIIALRSEETGGGN